MENDYRTARERISEERIRHILGCAETRVPLQNDRSEKGCLDGRSLAMVYSPCQRWQELYDLESGFCAGTMFKELDKPFLGASGMGGVFNG